MDVDYQEVTEKLYEAITEYHVWWKQKYPDEKIYGFCFFTWALVSYAGVTIFTEEGLEKVAQKYKVDEYYKNKSLELLKTQLRWSACDSPHHMENERIFEKVDTLLSHIHEEAYDLKHDDPEFDLHYNRLHQCFTDALNQFQKEQFSEPNKIFFTVWFGDISKDEIMNFAKSCNDQMKLDHFVKELEQGYEAFETS